MTMIFGICGREGAGKATIANIICSNEYICEKQQNPWGYILHCLFEFDLDFPKTRNRHELITSVENITIQDKIWNLTPAQALHSIFAAFDSVFPNIENYIAFDFYAPKGIQSNQVTMADKLKLICVPLSGITYDILLGSDENARKIRETRKFPCFGKHLTGREVLEQVGTQVFRENFEEDFWVKLTKHTITNLKGNVVIPDIRFQNEYNMLKDINGTLIIVCKNLKDLKLSNEDKKLHPAKWKFLEFASTISENSVIIINDSDIESLKKKVENVIAF